VRYSTVRNRNCNPDAEDMILTVDMMYEKCKSFNGNSSRAAEGLVVDNKLHTHPHSETVREHNKSECHSQNRHYLSPRLELQEARFSEHGIKKSIQRKVVLHTWNGNIDRMVGRRFSHGSKRNGGVPGIWACRRASRCSSCAQSTTPGRARSHSLLRREGVVRRRCKR